MAKNVVMPALEMAQETGTVVAWLKKEGDAVIKGEPILEIETDKATVEVEALADGILAAVTASEGDVIPVGQVIAWIVAPGEEPPKETQASASGRAMSSAARPSSKPGGARSAKSGGSGPAQSRATGGGKVSPKARRLAEQHGVDLSTVSGTGPDGIVTGDDILAAAKAGASGAGAARSAADGPALSTVARLMAERTTQSWTQAPHFFLTREVDASALNALRAKVRPGIEKDRGVKVTHTDLIVALIGRVLVRHPKMNGSWNGKGISLNPKVNVAVAVAVEDGVVSPVIQNASEAGLGDIALQRRDLAERAREGRLRPADISGATFTVSNLGMFGINAFTAIIVAPQAGILAVGAIVDRVVPVDGQPAIRPIMTMTLSSDHRVLDGAQAAVFLNDLAEAIANPDSWLA